MPESWVKTGSLWLSEDTTRTAPLAVRPCSRCHNEPRLPSQRWGRQCYAEYRRGERRRKRARPTSPEVRLTLPSSASIIRTVEATAHTRPAMAPETRQAAQDATADRQLIAQPLAAMPDRSPVEPPTSARFWCRQYPFLRIGIPGVGGVQFQKGLLETADPMVIAAIRKNDFYGGIIQEGEAPPPPPPVVPPAPREREYGPIILKRPLGDWTHPWRVKDT